jgi:hypothetical protein
VPTFSAASQNFKSNGDGAARGKAAQCHYENHRQHETNSRPATHILFKTKHCPNEIAKKALTLTPPAQNLSRAYFY